MEVIIKLTLAGAGIGIIPASAGEVFGIGKLVGIENSPQFKDERAIIYCTENRGVASILLLVSQIHQKLSP